MSGVGAKSQSGDAGRTKWGSGEGLVGVVTARKDLGTCVVRWKPWEFLGVAQYFREKTLAACVH